MRRALGVAAAVLLFAATALADDPVQLAIVSYGSIPAGSSFDIEATQNTELAAHVDNTLRDALTAHGFHYQPESKGLVFSVNADPTGRGESNLYLGIDDPNNAQVHIAIDTNHTGLSTNTMSRGYRISLGVYERASGRYIWRGEINDLKPDADPFAVTQPLLEKLLAALEKSVKPAE